jgi:hypothetical protein
MDTPRSPVTYNGPNNAFGGGSITFGLCFERADQYKGVPTVSFVDRNLGVPLFLATLRRLFYTRLDEEKPGGAVVRDLSCRNFRRYPGYKTESADNTRATVATPNQTPIRQETPLAKPIEIRTFPSVVKTNTS